MKLRKVDAGVSRRRFLRDAATLTGAGTAAVMAPPVIAQAVAASAQATKPKGVINAAHWGAFRAVAQGGRFTAEPIISSPADPLIRAIPDLVYSPTRVRHPYVRKGYLGKGRASDRTMRGRDEWVRVSWDQALTLVAGELARVRKEHGPQGIYGGSYGWKSSGKLHNCQSLLRRMMNLKGGFVNAPSGDDSTAASQIVMPHVMGTLEVYEQQTVWPVVAAETKLMVFWGADPVTTNQISWTVADHGAYPGLMEALKQAGTKVIRIDPVRTATCDYSRRRMDRPPAAADRRGADAGHRPHAGQRAAPRPGVPRRLRHRLQSSCPISWARPTAPRRRRGGVGRGSATCPRRPDPGSRPALRRDADDAPASGWSVQRQHHGEQTHWMLVTLACMLGQIGLPGGGFGFSYHYASGGSPTASGGTLAGITAGAAASGPEWLQGGGTNTIPLARVSDCLLNPGKTISFNGRTITYPDIKLLYWSGGNPFAHQQRRANLVRALPEAPNRYRQRGLLDCHSTHGGHRAARDHSVRTKRPRDGRGLLEPLHLPHAQDRGAGRRDAERFRYLRGDRGQAGP